MKDHLELMMMKALRMVPPTIKAANQNRKSLKRKPSKKKMKKILRPKKNHLLKTKTLKKSCNQQIIQPLQKKLRQSLQRRRRRQRRHLRRNKRERPHLQDVKRLKVSFLTILLQVRYRGRYLYKIHLWRKVQQNHQTPEPKNLIRKKHKKRFRKQKMKRKKTSGKSWMISTSSWTRRGLVRSSLTYSNH